jgi:hypothetical protein
MKLRCVVPRRCSAFGQGSSAPATEWTAIDVRKHRVCLGRGDARQLHDVTALAFARAGAGVIGQFDGDGRAEAKVAASRRRSAISRSGSTWRRTTSATSMRRIRSRPSSEPAIADHGAERAQRDPPILTATTSCAQAQQQVADGGVPVSILPGAEEHISSGGPVPGNGWFNIFSSHRACPDLRTEAGHPPAEQHLSEPTRSCAWCQRGSRSRRGYNTSSTARWCGGGEGSAACTMGRTAGHQRGKTRPVSSSRGQTPSREGRAISSSIRRSLDAARLDWLTQVLAANESLTCRTSSRPRRPT